MVQVSMVAEADSVYDEPRKSSEYDDHIMADDNQSSHAGSFISNDNDATSRENDDNERNNDRDDESNDFEEPRKPRRISKWIIVLIVLAVLLLIGVVVGVVFAVKKKNNRVLLVADDTEPRLTSIFSVFPSTPARRSGKRTTTGPTRSTRSRSTRSTRIQSSTPEIIRSTDPCTPNPCMNGATCFGSRNDEAELCLCPPGFTGFFCDEVQCQLDSCSNGGLCQIKNDAIECMCPPGYIGDKCQSGVVCLCQNGGYCLGNDNSCLCPPEYTGDRCQTEITRGRNTCQPGLCRNGGSCIETQDSYMCLCLPQYTGNNCDSISATLSPRRVDCSPSICLNGATCITQPSGYQCFCANGYSGTRCQAGPQTATSRPPPTQAPAQASSCSSNPCINRGTCVQGTNSYICFCQSENWGTHCEHSGYGACQPDPCQTGTFCIVTNTGPGYICL